MATKKYYPQLNALRAIAAFGVINLHWLNSDYPSYFKIDHSSHWGFGNYGVQLFFVLSGFLITDILLKYKNSKNRVKVIKSFFIRRILRLFPIYYLLLLFLLLVQSAFVQENIVWYLTYTSNFKFYLVGGFPDIWSNHTWTLSIEEQFYLVFPFLLFYTPKKFEIGIPIVLILSSLAFKTFLASDSQPFHLLTISQIDMLGIGVLLAYLKNRSTKGLTIFSGWISKITMVVTLLICLGIYYFAGKNSAIWVSFDYFLLLSFGLIVANAVIGFSGLIGRFFESDPFRYLGKVSYGLYLYHKIVPLTLLIFFKKFGLSFDGIWSYYLVNMGILLVVTHVSWKLIESPILKLKSNFTYAKSDE